MQLIGPAAQAPIVSFTAPAESAGGPTRTRSSFTITLRPRGGEQRFEVRLYSFEYQEEMSPEIARVQRARDGPGTPRTWCWSATCAQRGRGRAAAVSGH